MEMLALGYRSDTLCLWVNEEFFGWARDTHDRPHPQMQFNPNPSIKLPCYLQKPYHVYLDTWGNLIESQDPSVERGVVSAACSRYGRTLVTTDTQGMLQI